VNDIDWKVGERKPKRKDKRNGFGTGKDGLKIKSIRENRKREKGSRQIERREMKKMKKEVKLREIISYIQDNERLYWAGEQFEEDYDKRAFTKLLSLFKKYAEEYAMERGVEIDINKLFNCILDYKYPGGLPLLPNSTGGATLRDAYPDEYDLAKAIAEARPIKLKEVE